MFTAAWPIAVMGSKVRFYFLVPLRIIICNNYYVTDVHAHCSINCEVVKVHIQSRTILQWNPSITDTFGEQCFGLYTEVAFVERLFCTQTGPGCLAVT